LGLDADANFGQVFAQQNARHLRKGPSSDSHWRLRGAHASMRSWQCRPWCLVSVEKIIVKKYWLNIIDYILFKL
jgi:hypothetical protein